MEFEKLQEIIVDVLNVGAEDIENAFAITEYVEFCAELYVKAKVIGEPVILSKEEIDKHIEKFGFIL